MSTSDKPSDAAADALARHLNLETSQMPWQELLRFFAGGLVIAVSEELDLLEVAARIAQDDVDCVSEWMMGEQIAKVSDAQAADWLEQEATVWTVVVKPWILVQAARPDAPLH